MDFKTCTHCEVEKPVGAFSRRAASGDGFQSRCKACMAAQHQEWYGRNREMVRAKLGSVARYPKYATEGERQEARRQQAKRYRVRIGKEAVSRMGRASRLKREYGLTITEFNKLSALQNGNCACCGRRPKKLLVDHDHETGEVRGLLCPSCNVGIGLLGDTAQALGRALAYLKPDERKFQPFTFVG